MARLPRITIPGVPHHIVHRGNNKNPVFFEREDFEMYLRLLSRYTFKYNFRVLSYCLMTNHVHIVGIPMQSKSMINLVRTTHHQYSVKLNKKMGKCGHNWQSRYFSCPCDEFHGVSSMRYVELNPVRAGLVSKPWDYHWSSAVYHVGFKRYPNLLDFNWWKERFNTLEWEEMLMQEYESDVFPRIRNNTKSGLPLGRSEFHDLVFSQVGSELERKLRRRLKKRCQTPKMLSDTVFIPNLTSHFQSNIIGT